MSTNFPLQDEILRAAGLADLTGPRAVFVARKIQDDHEVLNIAYRLAAGPFVAEALKKMNPAQLERLRKRAQPEPAPETLRRVHWGVGQGPVSQQWFIKISAPNETRYFFGTPQAARTLKVFGEQCPPEVAEQYAVVYKPMCAPELATSEYVHGMTPSQSVRKEGGR